MKNIKFSIIPIIALVIGMTISCERDDICAESTPTTPRLIIDLLDFSNQENSKNAFNLVVFGIDNNEILPDFNFVTSNNLVLPLDTNRNSTQYGLIKDATLNDDGTIEGNVDTITINYTREEVYVSRACGFKTIYNNIEVVILDDGDKWLEGNPINLTNNEPVENENATHFNLFH